MNRSFSLGHLGLKGGLVVGQGLLVLGVEGRAAQALSHLEERLLSRRELARQRLGALGRSLEAKRCVHWSQGARLPAATFTSE